MEKAFYYKVCYTRWGAVGHGQQLTRIGPGEVVSHALDEAGGCALEVDGRVLDEAGGQEHGRKCRSLCEELKDEEGAEGGRKRIWLAIMRVIGQIPC